MSPMVRQLLGMTWIAVASGCFADQNAADLPLLIGGLTKADNAIHAAELEARIWDRWLEGPTETASAALATARARMSAGELSAAGIALDALVDSHPDFAEAWNQRAIWHFFRGEYRASLADIERTLDLEPRHFGALAGRGQCLLAMSDARGALSAFEDALAVNPWLSDVERQAESLRVMLASPPAGI